MIKGVKLMTKFKIDQDGKRTVKASCSGQVIEALRRAKAPLTLTSLIVRVKGTKAGKHVSVKDLKARVKRCADWYVSDDRMWVRKTADGEYFLTHAIEVPSE